MLILNIDYLPDKEVQVLSLVKGSTIQSKHLGKDIASGLKTIVGGELTAYTEMLEDARRIATERMVAEASALGADAIINVRFSSSTVAAGASEMLVYGTAVKYKVQDDLQQF